jgi:chromosome segregation ATPase
MSEVKLEVKNIGGIAQGSFSFGPGTTLIVGRNASNKTSFLRSLQFALGIDEIPVRSGADRASVQLNLHGREIKRQAKRNGTGYVISGDGWVSEPDETLVVKRFSCLLSTNPLRTAVEKSEDVESLLKEPIDIEALEAERAEKLSRKRDLRRDLKQLDDIETRLAGREDELAEKRERIETLGSKLDDLYDEQEESESDDDELEKLREERTDLRTKRGNYQSQIEELERTIERLIDRRSEIKSEIEEAREQTESHDIEALKRERDSIRQELAEITERIDVLQSVLSANRELLNSDYAGSLGYEAGLMNDEISCWACGNPTDRSDFENTIDELQELLKQDKQNKREREPELSEIESKIEEVNEARRRVQELKSELSNIDQRLQQRRDSLDKKRTDLDHIESELEDISTEIEAYESERAESRSGLATEIEETRLELQTLRREADRLKETIEELEEKRSQREQKQKEVEQLNADIQSLTSKIENREQDLQDVFNETMDELIETLDFERIERVRLTGGFKLVIAREVDGVVREDSIEHLAESEREVIGLVLGLAGYLVYDVKEVSQLLLIDSLGALDATRTERLIEYFSESTQYFLAAVHPEIADKLSYEMIRMS